jgi:hypothetical protein
MSYMSAPECCGNLDTPPVAAESYVNYSAMATTVDQERIEAVLASRDLSGARILHAGIGSSGLARRFSDRVALIDGLTISASEKAFADSLRVPNYTIFNLNKHTRDFNRAIVNRYDYIVDNNLASFACCKYHFYVMLDNFLSVLDAGGEILTDQYGLDWACFDPNFAMTFDDLRSLEPIVPVAVSKVTGTVYSLRSLGRRIPVTPTQSYRAVERDGTRVIEPRSIRLSELPS